MTEEEKHFSFVDKPFQVDMVKTIFNDEDLTFLKKYGRWMEGLYRGELSPISEEQRQFIQSMKNDEPPEKRQFNIFWRYINRLKLLKTQNLNNEKKLIEDDREDWKKIRKSRY